MFGDINFRVDQTYQEVIEKLQTKDYDYLLQHDQFLKLRENCPKYKIICEGKINFNPTYKYERFSDNYSNDPKKLRVPSWCDRIFFKSTTKIKLIEYNMADVRYSDHRPLYGLFEVSCEINTTDEKEILVEEMKQIEQKNKENFISQSYNFNKNNTPFSNTNQTPPKQNESASTTNLIDL